MIYLRPHVTGLLAQLRLNLHPPGCLRSSAKIALTGLLAQLRYNYKYLRLAANANGTAKPVMQAVRREPSGDLPRATHHRAACAAPLEFALTGLLAQLRFDLLYSQDTHPV